MKLEFIDSRKLKPTEYRHVHDSTILFKKHRENFNFGLSVDQYYFNQDPKDKKTNFNTQYTLTNLYSLSTIAELNIPFTTAAVSAFTTTIQQDGKYLKTDFTHVGSTVDSISSDFVSEGEFTAAKGLSSQFFFTFTISSIAADNIVGRQDTVFISQQYNSETYYLSAPGIQNTPAVWTTTDPSYFRYALDDNKITIHGYDTVTNILVNSVVEETNSWYWKAPGAWQNTITDLDDSFFTVNRNVLTKDFKDIPNKFNRYKSDYNVDNVVIESATSVNNNYFVFNNNYNFYQDNSERKFVMHADFFPLKNQATLHEYYSENNHFNAEPDTQNRIYEKIHAGVHQIDGYDKVGLSYNIGTYDMVFKPNKMTYFTTPNSMSPYTVLNINDSKIENLGAVPGNNPLMSDKVFKRREVIKNNAFSDDNDPMYLCSWLSGGSDGSTMWVDRYYNPLASNFESALSGTSHYNVITAAGAQTTETFDISSNLTFEPNNDYAYYHIGDFDYKKLFKAYDSKYNASVDCRYTTHKGIPIVPTMVKDDVELILDGTNFAKNNTDIQGDCSINFWLHTKTNNEPFCYKLLGNYFEDGVGIFNTDLVTPNIILPVANKGSRRYGTDPVSKLLFLNNDFEVYDEVVVKDGARQVEIIGVGRKDNFSEYYVLALPDLKNKETWSDGTSGAKIFVYNNNNNFVSILEDLTTVDPLLVGEVQTRIDDFNVSEDKVHVLFNPVDTAAGTTQYFSYNITNNETGFKGGIPSKTTHKDTLGKKGKIFRRKDESGVLKTIILEADSKNGYGNEVAFDSNNTPFIIKAQDPTDPANSRNFLIKGNGVYTDKQNRVLSGRDKRSKINGVVINDDDQIIILHDENTVSILNNDRKLLRTREYCNLRNSVIDQSYLDLIYDFEDGQYKKYILLLQEFNGGVRLSKIDPETLGIVYSKKLNGVNVGDLNLTKTITSYSYLKTIGANKNRLKIILKKRPKFHSSGVLFKTKSIIDFDISTLNGGYNHFFINISLLKGFMCLYVNGKLYTTVKFKAGDYALNNILETGMYIGAVSSPFYLTLANKLLQPKKYFVNNAKIKAFKIYNKTMNYFDMLAHYNYHMTDKDVIWSYPLGQRTYIDTIDKVIKFNYPEKISNEYKIDIKNTNITDNKLIDKLEERIKDEIPKLTPFFDKAKNVYIS